MKKNQFIKLTNKWFIHNSYMIQGVGYEEEGRYKPWLRHKHKDKNSYEGQYQDSYSNIRCERCHEQAPKWIGAAFELIIHGWIKEHYDEA